MTCGSRKRRCNMQRQSLTTPHKQTDAQPFIRSPLPCKFLLPSMTSYSTLVSLGQLSRLCPLTTPCPTLPTSCHTGKKRILDAMQVLLSKSRNTVLSTLLQLQIQNTPPYRPRKELAPSLTDPLPLSSNGCSCIQKKLC